MLMSDGTSYNLFVRYEDKILTYSFHEPCQFAEFYKNSEELKYYCEIIKTLLENFNLDI